MREGVAPLSYLILQLSPNLLCVAQHREASTEPMETKRAEALTQLHVLFLCVGMYACASHNVYM